MVLIEKYQQNKDKEPEKHEMIAREIQYKIVNNYKTDKVRINGVKIAKRLKGRENIAVRHGANGLCYYRYFEN